MLDAYLVALKAKDPALAPWAAKAVTSENNVVLAVGDGMWGTVTGLGGYDLRFADTTAGQVGLLRRRSGDRYGFTLCACA